MRILQVATDSNRRGAQIFAHQLGPLLGDGDWTVRTVALTAGGDGPQLPFDVLGERRLGGSTLTRLRRSVIGADAVIGFGSTTLPACGITTFGSGVPFVYRSIGDLSYWAATPSKKLRVRLLLRRATRVVALWPEAARTVEEDFGVPAERVAMIPRGVDTRHFAPMSEEYRARARAQMPIPNSAPTACVVGSLAAEKAVDVAIAAASHVEDLHLLVAGAGPLRSELEAQAKAVLGGRVHFLGAVSDTRPVYAASDLLLLPSWSEGVPGVVIEAGLCGCPTVATDVGGTSSVIDHDVTGQLVVPGQPEAMAESIRTVLRNRVVFGAAARSRYVERFSLTRIGRSWTELLQTI